MDAARFVDIQPSTVKRHLADLRARSGLTTEQLIYVGRARGHLVVPSLESVVGHRTKLLPPTSVGNRLRHARRPDGDPKARGPAPENQACDGDPTSGSDRADRLGRRP